MKTFVSILPVVMMGLSLVPSLGLAGDGPVGHSYAPAINEKQVSALATTEVQRLVKIQKLDTAWTGAGIKNVSRAGAVKDWVVQFENGQATDPSMKNLYVILSQSGSVKAVNFKGVQKSHSHAGGAPHWA